MVSEPWGRPPWTAGSQCCTRITRSRISFKCIQYLATASWILEFLTPAKLSSLTTCKEKVNKNISFWRLFPSFVSSEIHRRAECLPSSMKTCCSFTAQGCKTWILCVNFTVEKSIHQCSQTKDHYLLLNLLGRDRSKVQVSNFLLSRQLLEVI